MNSSLKNSGLICTSGFYSKGNHLKTVRAKKPCVEQQALNKDFNLQRLINIETQPTGVALAGR